MSLSKPKDLIRYVPNFDRKNFKNPLIVHIKPLTAIEHDQWIAMMQEEFKETPSPEKRKLIGPAYQEDLFLRQIKKVENYFDQDGTTPITDVKQFYNEIDVLLREELTLAYKDHGALLDGELKNLSGD